MWHGQVPLERGGVCGIGRSFVGCGVEVWNAAFMLGIQRKGVEFGAKGGIQRKRVEFGSKSGIRAFHTGIRIPYWNSRFHRGIQPKGVKFTKQRGIGRRSLGDVGRHQDASLFVLTVDPQQ